MAKGTPATVALEKAGIAFTLHEYAYDPNAQRIGLQAAEALGVEPARLLKTLMVKVEGAIVCLLVPSDRAVSLKKLAAAMNAKDAFMLPPPEAERVTGYRIGGISPFGQKKRVAVLIEAAALAHQSVIVNGGRRGLQIELPPREIVRLPWCLACLPGLSDPSSPGMPSITRKRVVPPGKIGASAASFPQLKTAQIPMPRPRLAPLDIAIYCGVVFAWSFSWIALHFQVGVVAPEVSVVWRFVLAAPVMFVIAALRGEPLRFAPADHLWLTALGITLFSTNFTLFYYGGLYLASGLLAVVFSLASVINVWLGWLVLRAPIDRRVVAGGLLGFSGIAAMVYPQLAGTQFNHDVLVGLAFSVAGTFSFCFGNMISAQLQRRGIPVFAASGYGMTYGAAALAAFAALRGHSFKIDSNPAYVGSLIYLAMIGSVMAFACYLTLLGRIGADRAAYSTVMFPVVALAVSTAYEGYNWSLASALGLVAVLAGNVLVLRPARRD